MEKCGALEQKMLKELELIENKLGNTEMTEADLKRVDMLAHALKSLATYKAMKGYDVEEPEGYSGRRGRSMPGPYMSRDPMMYDPYYDRRPY